MIDLIIVSNTCSDSYFQYLQSIKKAEKLSPSQKYFDLLIRGLVGCGCRVTCVTARSIDAANCDLKKLPYHEECVNGVTYIYPEVVGKKFIKNLKNIKNGRRCTKKVLGDDAAAGRQSILILDPLSYDISCGALQAAGKRKTCALVTDLPAQMIKLNKTGLSGAKNALRLFLMNKVLKRADTYCFLTESMNVVNSKNKPYVVIEGMTAGATETNERRSAGKVVLYAGGLYEQFGVLNLIEAFKTLRDPALELHLYGEGPLVDRIVKTSETFGRIRYGGVLETRAVMEKETTARILINPRPCDEEFTKYSFPSKTIEYMSAGRPVLTTRLPGIPHDYDPYLFFIDDTSPAGIASAVERVNALPDEELDRMGRAAAQYVAQSKNNRAQAARLFAFLTGKDPAQTVVQQSDH